MCRSREICAELYQTLISLRPDRHDADPEKGAIKVVMTGPAADKALLQVHLYSQQMEKRLEKRFKDPADPLKLVIVRDMWLTGFDAPCCHTMYVDKSMQGHNLMQAIARVNRVFRNKPGGLVVGYIDIANELKTALKTYTKSKGGGAPAHNAAEALMVLLEKLDIVRGLMHGFDYSGFARDALAKLAARRDQGARTQQRGAGRNTASACGTPCANTTTEQCRRRRSSKNIQMAKDFQAALAREATLGAEPG